MFNSLIDGQDGEVTSSRKPAADKQALKVAQHARVAISGGEDAVDEIGPRQVQRFTRNCLTAMLEQRLRAGPQDFDCARHYFLLAEQPPSAKRIPAARSPEHGRAV